jgi:multicomponent Na+:H+ antiporter subunit F
MSTFIYIMLSVLGMAVLFTFVRLARGPTMPDRIAALDLMSVLALAMMATYAMLTNEPVYLDVGIVQALVTFVGTVAFASYLERSKQ